MSSGIACMLMRGGTSKGAYFLAADLPPERTARDKVLLAVMGSPDRRQIDGIGGAHPLTSKIAIVAPSQDAGADVTYLFLQIGTDRPTVDDGQNCGNLLAGIGPFAIERGLVAAADGTTEVRIHMLNSNEYAVARVQTPKRRVTYDGTTRIDGVPNPAAPVVLEFLDIAGATCGALLPTGHAQDRILDHAATLIDNGMPVVALRAADFGLSGQESPAMLEANDNLRTRIEAIRRAAGPMMALGDVSAATTPKIALLSPPRAGGSIATQSFIPHRVHESIGVFAALSVATACVLPGTVAAGMAVPGHGAARHLAIEHPTGALGVSLSLDETASPPHVLRAGVIRTARKLFDGTVFIPG